MADILLAKPLWRLERENWTLKAKLANHCEETGLSWVRALPLALFYVRMRKRAKNNLSPFDILFGRPPVLGLNPPAKPHLSTDLRENAMMSYCQNLSKTLNQVNRQGSGTTPSDQTRRLGSDQGNTGELNDGKGLFKFFL